MENFVVMDSAGKVVDAFVKRGSAAFYKYLCERDQYRNSYILKDMNIEDDNYEKKDKI